MIQYMIELRIYRRVCDESEMANYKSLSSHLHKLHQFYFLLQDAYLRNYYQILEEDLSIKGTLFSLVQFYSFRLLIL